MNIAVIGSGVSGLVCAWILNRNHHVTLYESDSRIGGHINTITIWENGNAFPVDTGFIVFNQPNYPQFNRIINKLGIESQPSRMSFSVADERSGIEYSGSNLLSLFAGPRNIIRSDHWRMLAEVRRFITCLESLDADSLDLTVEESLKAHGYSPAFTERFLGPLACALWSCPHESLLNFPIRFVTEFLLNHQLINLHGRPTWRTIKGGSRTYVDRLITQLSADIRISSRITRVERESSHIRVHTSNTSRNFDEVIIATHADDAIALLLDPTPQERDILTAFPYQSNDVCLHTDTSLLPRSRRAWSSWNYRISRNALPAATVTYNMNILQSLKASQTYCVSLNQTSDIRTDSIIARFDYRHPTPTLASIDARKLRDTLIRHRGISYCGAYWGNGFHEAGVQSAIEVCAAFGESL